MYYQNFEDYMRTVLGYPVENQCTYARDLFEEMPNYQVLYEDRNELEDCYPEIHKVLYPMVCEMCDNCSKPITRDKIEEMVEKISEKVEQNHEISIRINIDNRAETKEIEIKDGKQKYFIDTIELNKKTMIELGLVSKNIISSGICTKCNSDLYHSYRADGKLSGRNLSLICMK